MKFDKDMSVELSCDYCKGSVGGTPHVLKFGNFARFFCCTCKSLYKEKEIKMMTVFARDVLFYSMVIV